MRAISFGKHASGCDTATQTEHYVVFHKAGDLPQACNYQCPGFDCSSHSTTIHTGGTGWSKDVCFVITWMWILPIPQFYTK